MKRLAVGVLFSFSLVILAQASPAPAGGTAGFGCSPAFNGYTFTQSLELPRIQAALDAGIITADQLQASFATLDHNGDGVICLQLPPGWENANPAAGKQYFYNAVDDNSSA